MGGKNKSKSKKNKTHVDSDEIKSKVAIATTFSKDMCVLLAMGGSLNATEYAEVLDNFPANHELHTDDEIDDIMNAMEEHEDNRKGLSKAMHSLASAFESSSDRATSTSTSTSSPQSNELLFGSIDIEVVENSISSLYMTISAYKEQIRKQRRDIEHLRISLSQRSSIFFQSHSNSNSQGPGASIGQYSTFCIEIMVAFNLLAMQYRSQLDWEDMMLAQIEKILRDGTIYRYLEVRFGDGDGGSNGGGDGGGDGDADNNSAKRETNLRRDILRWSFGIDECTKLDQTQWTAIKKKLLDEIMPRKQEKNGKISRTTNMNILSTERLANASKIISSENEKVSMSTHDTGPTAMEGFAPSPISIQGVVNRFVGHHVFDPEIFESGIGKRLHQKDQFVLLLGPSGSGKTFLCDTVEERISMLNKKIASDNNIKVIRPRLPADFLGPSVGSFENSILSLVEASQQSCKCILLLDDVDHILGRSFVEVSANGSSDSALLANEQHIAYRIRSIFISAMDKLRECKKGKTSERQLLAICTSRSHDDGVIDRFDGKYFLAEPDSVERRYLIETCLSLPKQCEQIGLGEQIASMIASTVGKSRGEIAQFGRTAVERVPKCKSIEDCAERLRVMKQSLQEIIPESIRSQPSEGSFDMRVSSAKELQLSVIIDENGCEVLPLLGQNATECWEKLENIIITPFCRWKELDLLLYGNKKMTGKARRQKAISSSLLLAGDPGTGKTALAYHCAAVAAGLDPKVRLLEVSCTSLVQKEVGGSERNVRKLFNTVRAAAPCILILDGIENIAPVRGHDNTSEGTMDRLLSTLLTEMDGVTSDGMTSLEEDGNVVAIIGITHNPPSWIDPALLRPGRLEKCIVMGKPNNSARGEIFGKAIKDISIDFSGAGYFDPKDKKELQNAVAMRTNGLSAAEIIALCENAKMLALRDVLDELNASKVTHKNLNVCFRHFLS